MKPVPVSYPHVVQLFQQFDLLELILYVLIFLSSSYRPVALKLTRALRTYLGCPLFL